VSGARLQPRPLPADLASVDGSWRGEPMRWRARAYAGPAVAYARVVTLAGGEVEIANLLCVPRSTRALPMLGVDLVLVAPSRGALVVADLSPPPGVTTTSPPELLHARSTLTPAGVLPPWAQRCFSATPLFVRVDGAHETACAATAVSALVRTFVDATRNTPSDDDLVALRGRARWTQETLAAHRAEDRTLDLLARMFPTSVARRLIEEVLFPENLSPAA
jgi:hypothetical protein